MYETSLHTLQPDQGLNQKQSTRRSFPQKTAHNTQPMRQKKVFHAQLDQA